MSKQTEWLTMQEAADALGAGVDTIYRYLRSGTLAGRSGLTSPWLVSRASVVAFRASKGNQ